MRHQATVIHPFGVPVGQSPDNVHDEEEGPHEKGRVKWSNVGKGIESKRRSPFSRTWDVLRSKCEETVKHECKVP